MEKLLHKVYYDLDSPACFSGQEAVYKEARRHSKKVSRKQVERFLHKQDTYTKHKAIRRRFPRNKTVPTGFHTDWQSDICDLRKLKRYNKGFAYILTVLDVLSRYAWAVPLKTKTPKEVRLAFKGILETSGEKCFRLCTDAGLEFRGKPFQDLLKEEYIKHVIPKNETKAACVERYNRTLKTRLYKLFTKNNSYNWIDHLPKIVKAINNSTNRITGCTPASVNHENATKLWLRLYGKPKKDIKFKFNIGDQARISRYKDVFEKGYTPNFTEEIFTVYERLNRAPPVYRLKSQSGEPLQGTFYETELVKVIKDSQSTYDIEKIVSSRTKQGVKQLLVKWSGYPDSENSWIKESDLVSK